MIDIERSHDPKIGGGDRCRWISLDIEGCSFGVVNGLRCISVDAEGDQMELTIKNAKAVDVTTVHNAVDD